MLFYTINLQNLTYNSTKHLLIAPTNKYMFIYIMIYINIYSLVFMICIYLCRYILVRDIYCSVILNMCDNNINKYR